MFSNYNGSIDTSVGERNFILNNSINDFVDLRSSNIALYVQTILVNKLFDPFIVGNYEEVQDNFKQYYDDIIQYLYKNSDIPLVPELLKSISVLERAMLLIKEIESKDSQIKGLKNKIDNIYNDEKGANVEIETSVQADAILDMAYILYIREFGPPDNGIFDPIKLASLR
jgi:hypothetical protein